MRIERPTMSIFDVPGIDRIEVTAGRPVKVSLLPGTDCVDWDQADLGAVIEALQAARTELLRLDGQSIVPRTFRRGDSIPGDVTVIKGRENDLWHRAPGQRWTPEQGDPSPWHESGMLSALGPFTEVRA